MNLYCTKGKPRRKETLLYSQKEMAKMYLSWTLWKCISKESVKIVVMVNSSSTCHNLEAPEIVVLKRNFLNWVDCEHVCNRLSCLSENILED